MQTSVFAEYIRRPISVLFNDFKNHRSLDFTQKFSLWRMDAATAIHRGLQCSLNQSIDAPPTLATITGTDADIFLRFREHIRTLFGMRNSLEVKRKSYYTVHGVVTNNNSLGKYSTVMASFSYNI